MCGIWFSVGFEANKEHIDVVAHRGPDGSGMRMFSSSRGPVVLGHRRLAIIDTSEAANQPMSYADERFWIVYNGELYNHIELRKELESLGHSFRTRSDTEVILAAYAQWGAGCVNRFLGMFAFVIYEPEQERWFAARDRFGIKPLYYFTDRNGVAVASEIKQLLLLPGVSARMNLARTYDFLAASMTDHAADTMFDGIMQLRNGEQVCLRLDEYSVGAPLPVQRWYRLPEQGALDLSEEEAASRFLELLSQSVRLHLRSDVPVGSCLSGGLDSSSVVCLIDRHLRTERSSVPLHTFSACYDVKEVDEKPYVDVVTAATNTDAHIVYPRADDLFALAERLTWHQDEPFGSTSIYAQWCVFERARREGIKVMLDGQGADEQLAGYHTGFPIYTASLLRRGLFFSLLVSMAQRRREHGISVTSQIFSLIAPLIPFRLRNLLKSHRQRFLGNRWLRSEVFDGASISRDPSGAALMREGLSPARDIGEWCVALTAVINLQMLLRYEDRNSMAHGVEARVPFLDHRLVELSIGLGERYKIVGAETKRVLRLAMRGILPDQIRERRDKIGFATPEEQWFRGPLRKEIEGGVEDTLRLYPGLLNEDETRTLMKGMFDGLRPFDFTVWRILNLGLWGRVFSVSL
jgi:asparagine synthase (glutamine-hydrolysing)